MMAVAERTALHGPWRLEEFALAWAMRALMMAGLTLLVCAEKILPRGAAIAEISGAGMIAAALWRAT